MTEPEEKSIAQRWSLMRDQLNEDQQRLFLGVEAEAFGDRGESVVARATGSSRTRVRDGKELLENLRRGVSRPEEFRPLMRVRREGAGRKSVREKYPDLVPTLMKVVEPGKVLERPSPLLWTTQTRDKLVEELGAHGFQVSGSALLELLREEGFRVGRAYKARNDANRPEARDQFAFVSQRVALAQIEGQPVVAMELFRVSRNAQMTDGASTYTAGLRRHLNERFEDEDPKLRHDGRCEVCGATQHQPGELVSPSSETIDFAAAALEQWWKQEVADSAHRVARLVLVVAGLAGDEQAMRQLRDQLSRAHKAMRMRLEVLHVPPGIRRWRRVARRFTLATNDYIVDRSLERHEIILEFPGGPREALRGRLEASQPSIDAAAKPGGQVCVGGFAQYPRWNYAVAEK